MEEKLDGMTQAEYARLYNLENRVEQLEKIIADLRAEINKSKIGQLLKPRSSRRPGRRWGGPPV